MMPVIRISDDMYERLQKHATPFVDTPATVIERLLDAYESAQTTDPEGEKPQQSEAGSDFWFVNVGESPYRNWDDCVAYGFLSAGWDRKYSDPLKRLTSGSEVFAYMAGRGYVGYGEVICEVCPVKDFTPAGYNQPLLDLELNAEEMDHSQDDEDKCEWVVGVRWHRTFSRDEARTFTGAFANPNIVCRLKNQPTLDFLRREFCVSAAGQ